MDTNQDAIPDQELDTPAVSTPAASTTEASPRQRLQDRINTILDE